MRYKGFLNVRGMLMSISCGLFLLLGDTSAQVNDETEIAVGFSEAGFIQNSKPITLDDIELVIDGRRQKILRVFQEERPISLVLVILTSPWETCGEEFPPFLENIETYTKKLFRENDEVGIVVSDQTGRTIREFPADITTFAGDLETALKLARNNKHENFNAEYHSTEYTGGLVYPLKALRSAIDMLSHSPVTNDKVIVFVGGLSNTRTGDTAEVRELFQELLTNNINFNWLAKRQYSSRFDPKRIRFGNRQFYMELPEATGGYLNRCNQKKDDYRTVWGRGKLDHTSLEEDLGSILNKIRSRHRVIYDRDHPTGRMIEVRLSVSRPGVSNGPGYPVYPRVLVY